MSLRQFFLITVLTPLVAVGSASAQPGSRPSTTPGRFPWLPFADGKVPIFGPAPEAGPPKPEAPAGGGQADVKTDAEKIARLQRTIESSEKQLEQIKRQLDAPDSEYKRAAQAFQELDGSLNAKKKQREQLEKAGKTVEAAELGKVIDDVRKQWEKARDRFNLAIEERKTLQEKLATLPAKMEREKKALQRLLGGSAPPNFVGPPEPPRDGATVCDPAKDAPKVVAGPGTPPKDDKTLSKTAFTDTTEQEQDVSRKESDRLRKAREAAKAKQSAARTAQDKADTVAGYLTELKRQIDLETKLLSTAKKKAANARQTQTELEAERQKRVDAGVPEEELARLTQQVNDAARQHEEAETDVRDIAERLGELEASYGRVDKKQHELADEADKAHKSLKTTEDEIDRLQNPLHPQNILQWLIDHGGKLLAILLGMIGLHFIVRTLSKRIVRVMAGTRKRAGEREGENRAETLVSVFRNCAAILILGGGLLMVLDEVGIPIVPLMGGAAVFGLAIAFGAQNLIRDYFSGFMVLLEDQYQVNDVVRINGIDGKVERITLRVTVLRDLAGIAHFVPHGTITTVSNYSHGWSRASFEIGVAYKENVDRVIDVLKRLCDEICLDETFGPLIIDQPEMLGVDSLGDSSVNIKFVLKTKPMKQWDVKREMLRRIKNKFDQLGIEIPFPHQTVYYRQEGTANGEGEQRGPWAA